MILYINSCVRENSRTERLANALLGSLGEYEELKLEELDLRPLDRETLEKRTELIESGKLYDGTFEYARKFASADTIVIAAPFWDYSFPALLKIFLENIYVTGIVSRYSDEGIPYGMCRAKKLFYVTTAGGQFVPDFSYNYIKALAQFAFGIGETELVCAENLDIVGNDPEQIVNETIKNHGWNE